MHPIIGAHQGFHGSTLHNHGSVHADTWTLVFTRLPCYPGLVCASAFVVQGYCASMCFRFPPPSQCHQYVKPLSFGAIIRTARDGASRCTLGLRQRQPIKMSALTESLTANSVVTTLRHRLATAIFSSPAALLAPLVPLWL